MNTTTFQIRRLLALVRSLVKTLCVLLSFFGSALHSGNIASAAPVSAVVFDPTASVYAYDAYHDPVLVPDATILDGGVYTDTGFLGMITQDNLIVDPTTNDVVGFLDYSVSPG